MMLSKAWHGKDRVRVAKVYRAADGTHDFDELEVRVQLEGGTDPSFIRGDNRMVVATDTCKNHVYIVAKKHSADSPECFSIALAQSFLDEYQQVNLARILVVEKPWTRLRYQGVPHKHGFLRGNMGAHVVHVIGRRAGKRHTIDVVSGIQGFDILKTTQSGWEKFHRGRYQTLPDTRERILATSVSATWRYTHNKKPDYAKIYKDVRGHLMETFFGPPRTGRYSAGVQSTLYKMGCEILKHAPEIREVSLSLPNIHFLPCNLPVFKKNGIAFEDDVYIPTDEPHGIIAATVSRPGGKL